MTARGKYDGPSASTKLLGHEGRHVANNDGARVQAGHVSKVQEAAGFDRESDRVTAVEARLSDKVTAVEASGLEGLEARHEQSAHVQACASTAGGGTTASGSTSRAVRRITRPSTKDVHLLF